MRKILTLLVFISALFHQAETHAQCTATITPGNILCNGNTGSATANPAGGTAPYFYLWNNAETTQTITGLAPGTYTVDIHDSQCTASGVELVNNGDFSAGNTGFSSGYSYCFWPGCLSPEGNYAIGTNPATYNGTWVGVDHTTGTGNFMIVNGAPTAGTSVWCQTIAVIPNTNYLFSTWVSSMNSGNPALLQFSTNGIPLGSIFSAPPSANIWQQFFSPWNSGANTSVTICIVNQNTTANGNDFGLDDISFQQCQYCTSTATVTITQAVTLITAVSSNTVSCFGGANGGANTTVSGGTSPYTYLWNNSQSTQNATGLAAGSYSVLITDANGCTGTQTASITQPAALTASATSTNPGCSNGTGSGTANASGGTGPYSYLWSSSQTTQTVSGLSAGTYSVLAVDANGCTCPAQTITITPPAPIVLTASVTPTICSVNTGSATVNASGGTGSYTYLWNSAAGGQTTQTAIGLGAGAYAVVVTDANGCIQVQTAIVTSNNTLTVSTTSTLSGCTVSNGTASANPSNGTSPYSYSWSNGQTSAVATGLGSGNYTITVTDANGCTQVQTVTITSNNTLTVSASSTPTGCTVSNGTATANPGSGTAPYSYSWSNGQTSATATGLGIGNYSITITDSNGCTAVSVANVTGVSTPVVTATATLTNITLGENTQLSSSGGGTYNWSPTTGLSCATCSNPIATPSATTIYCVLVTDANGCSDSACVLITVEIPCGTLYLPNAFSPNGDGEDDELQIYIGRPDCIESFDLKIFDRWGEKIYQTTDPAFKWDGVYNKGMLQAPAPSVTAVYAYYMNVHFSDGSKIKKEGNISLLR